MRLLVFLTIINFLPVLFAAKSKTNAQKAKKAGKVEKVEPNVEYEALSQQLTDLAGKMVTNNNEITSSISTINEKLSIIDTLSTNIKSANERIDSLPNFENDIALLRGSLNDIKSSLSTETNERLETNKKLKSSIEESYTQLNNIRDQVAKLNTELEALSSSQQKMVLNLEKLSASVRDTDQANQNADVLTNKLNELKSDFDVRFVGVEKQLQLQSANNDRVRGAVPDVQKTIYGFEKELKRMNAQLNKQKTVNKNRFENADEELAQLRADLELVYQNTLAYTLDSALESSYDYAANFSYYVVVWWNNGYQLAQDKYKEIDWESFPEYSKNVTKDFTNKVVVWSNQGYEFTRNKLKEVDWELYYNYTKNVTDDLLDKAQELTTNGVSYAQRQLNRMEWNEYYGKFTDKRNWELFFEWLRELYDSFVDWINKAIVPSIKKQFGNAITYGKELGVKFGDFTKKWHEHKLFLKFENAWLPYFRQIGIDQQYDVFAIDFLCGFVVVLLMLLVYLIVDSFMGLICYCICPVQKKIVPGVDYKPAGRRAKPKAGAQKKANKYNKRKENVPKPGLLQQEPGKPVKKKPRNQTYAKAVDSKKGSPKHPVRVVSPKPKPKAKAPGKKQGKRSPAVNSLDRPESSPSPIPGPGPSHNAKLKQRRKRGKKYKV